jgi:hypothetical protein
MTRMHGTLLALVAVLGVAAAGCQKEKSTNPTARSDPFSAPWVGTWSVTTQVNWSGGLNCPADTIVSALLVIQDGDKVNHLLGSLLPSSLQEMAQDLQCGMTVNGSDISFNCGLVGTFDGCIVSTSQNGSGSAGATSFKVTMDAQYQVQGSSQCAAVDCSMNAVSNANRIAGKEGTGGPDDGSARLPGASSPSFATTSSGLRYN